MRRNGNAGPGPFLPFARQEILDALLKLEGDMGIPLIADAELAYIQNQWSDEFDFQNRLGVEIAAKHGRRIAMPNAGNIAPTAEDDLLEQAALESGIDPDLLRQALDIRRKGFPSLDKWGAKTQFERAIGDLLDKAARQAEQTPQV